MKPPLVVAPGSINVDLILKTTSLKGPKTFHGDYAESQGGKGSNQAIAARRAGTDDRDVYLVGCVGQDEWGGQALQVLRSSGVYTDYVRIHPQIRTGVVMEYLYGDGEVTIALDLGANAAVNTHDITTAGPHIESAAMLLAQIETSLDALESALRRAHMAGVPTMLDPSIVPAAGSDRRRLLDEILPLIDLIAPNRSETQSLTDIDVTDDASALRAAAQLHERVPMVVITRGADGAVISRADEHHILRGHVVDAIDAGAAGDTFRGALACALAEALEAEQGPADGLAHLPFPALVAAAQFANAAAALCVTRVGAAPSIPHRHEIENLLRSQSAGILRPGTPGAGA
jgi:ribokinase